MGGNVRSESKGWGQDGEGEEEKLLGTGFVPDLLQLRNSQTWFAAAAAERAGALYSSERNREEARRGWCSIGLYEGWGEDGTEGRAMPEQEGIDLANGRGKRAPSPSQFASPRLWPERPFALPSKAGDGLATVPANELGEDGDDELPGDGPMTQPENAAGGEGGEGGSAAAGAGNKLATSPRRSCSPPAADHHARLGEHPAMSTPSSSAPSLRRHSSSLSKVEPTPKRGARKGLIDLSFGTADESLFPAHQSRGQHADTTPPGSREGGGVVKEVDKSPSYSYSRRLSFPAPIRAGGEHSPGHTPLAAATRRGGGRGEREAPRRAAVQQGGEGKGNDFPVLAARHTYSARGGGGGGGRGGGGDNDTTNHHHRRHHHQRQAEAREEGVCSPHNKQQQPSPLGLRSRSGDFPSLLPAAKRARSTPPS